MELIPQRFFQRTAPNSPTFLDPKRTRHVYEESALSAIRQCASSKDRIPLGMTTARRPTARAAVLDTDALPAPLSGSRISLPAGVRPFKLNWPYIIVIGGYHALAVLAFMPGYF